MTIAEQLSIRVPKRCRLLATVRGTMAIWRRRTSTRAALRDLELWRLPDVGITATERRRECAKWFWQK